VSRPTGAPRGSRGRHRQQPRWGRIGVLCCSLLVTVATAAAAAGLLPLVPREPAAVASVRDDLHTAAPAAKDPGDRSGARLVDAGSDRRGPARSGTTDPARPPQPPARSGHGRRVVFDMSEQRVWLVRDGGQVATSYLVSGGLSDNLTPDRYAVYSRSRHATGFDLQSTMQYMVRFAQGDRAAIGFHDIPVDRDGRLVQDPSELGTPQSAGCIRQRRADARRMWDFATVGTPVVVTA